MIATYGEGMAPQQAFPLSLVSNYFAGEFWKVNSIKIVGDAMKQQDEEEGVE